MRYHFNLFGNIFRNKDEIILRDYLALERTKLANERTLLAYSRTSLYMLLGGIAFLQMQDFSTIRWLAYVVLSSSIVIFVVGMYRYFQIKYRLDSYYKKSHPYSEAEENNGDKS